MEHVPVGSIVLLLTSDIALVLALSMAVGGSMARGSGTAAWKGVAVGLLVPVLGPLVWGVVALGRDRGRIRATRLRGRSPVLLAVLGTAVVAALLFVVGMFLPWAHVGGDVSDYRFATDASAIDTGVGLGASVATAAVAVGSAAVAFVWTAWRRVAFLMVALGSVWLLVTIDGLIVFSALGDVGEAVDGLSAGRASAGASAAPGLWCALAGAVLMTGSAVVLGWLPREARTLVPTADPTPGLTPAPVAATGSWGAATWGAPEPARPVAAGWGGPGAWDAASLPPAEQGREW